MNAEESNNVESERMNQVQKKVKRILNLDEAIRYARILKDERKLTELCILLTLERIEDRLGMIAFLLKQQIHDGNLYRRKKVKE